MSRKRRNKVNRAGQRAATKIERFTLGLVSLIAFVIFAFIYAATGMKLARRYYR